MRKDLFKWKNKFKIFNENMNTEFYLDILKEKNSEIRNLWEKGFILMRDNALFMLVIKLQSIWNQQKWRNERIGLLIVLI